MSKIENYCVKRFPVSFIFWCCGLNPTLAQTEHMLFPWATAPGLKVTFGRQVLSLTIFLLLLQTTSTFQCSTDTCLSKRASSCRSPRATACGAWRILSQGCPDIYTQEQQSRSQGVNTSAHAKHTAKIKVSWKYTLTHKGLYAKRTSRGFNTVFTFMSTYGVGSRWRQGKCSPPPF